MPNRDIVAIGASAGGMEVLRRIAAELPADLQASVFVVMHFGSGRSMLPEILGGSGPLPATFAEDGAPFAPGRVYVAPPQHHLLIEDGHTLVRRGPRENGYRPAIDPMFRSVAVAHGPRAIGVIASGALNDGTAGLVAIKRCGGLAIVQDPADAAYPSMPQSALDTGLIDHVATARGMGSLIARLVGERTDAKADAPREMRREVEIVAHSDSSPSDHVGKPDAVLSCPDCGGRMNLVDDTVLRFRCLVGHAHTAETLLSAQSKDVERALWVALRTNEERADLLRRMAADAERHKRGRSAEAWREKALEYEGHVEVLRGLLLDDNFLRHIAKAGKAGAEAAKDRAEADR